MIEAQLLKYCYFYHGEVLCPPSFDGKDEGKLWVAEKFVCEEMPNLVDPKHPRESIASAVGAYVCKWSPFTAEAIMETYLEKSKHL